MFHRFIELHLTTGERRNHLAQLCKKINNFVPNPKPLKIEPFSAQNSGAELIADFASLSEPMGAAATANSSQLHP
jgi:hypothetical protein